MNDLYPTIHLPYETRIERELGYILSPSQTALIRAAASCDIVVAVEMQRRSGITEMLHAYMAIEGMTNPSRDILYVGRNEYCGSNRQLLSTRAFRAFAGHVERKTDNYAHFGYNSELTSSGYNDFFNKLKGTNYNMIVIDSILREDYIHELIPYLIREQSYSYYTKPQPVMWDSEDYSKPINYVRYIVEKPRLIISVSPNMVSFVSKYLGGVTSSNNMATIKMYAYNDPGHTISSVVFHNY